MVMSDSNSRHIFRPPHINNNYRVYLRNDIDPKRYKQYLLNLYAGLNNADSTLKKWFEKSNELLQVSSITTILQEWTKKLEKKQNLAGVYYAMAIIKEFDKKEMNVLQLLQKEQPQLIDNFTNLPEELLTVSRINQCVPYDDLPTLFNQLCSEVLIDPKIRTTVERVEALLTSPAEQNIKYPTLIIYLDNKAIKTQQDLNYMLEKFNEYFIRYPQQTQIDNTFADPWNAFVNVTQGFKLHKVYLNALGVIDRVYSKESGFAYRINDGNSGLEKLGFQPVKNLLSAVRRLPKS
jgi:hypothetical protein